MAADEEEDEDDIARDKSAGSDLRCSLGAHATSIVSAADSGAALLAPEVVALESGRAAGKSGNASGGDDEAEQVCRRIGRVAWTSSKRHGLCWRPISFLALHLTSAMCPSRSLSLSLALIDYAIDLAAAGRQVRN